MNDAELTAACKEGMRLATEKPGRYGGRYIARRYDRKAKRDIITVLEDDDPDTLGPMWDVLAQATPKEIRPFGAARYYLATNGNVIRND